MRKLLRSMAKASLERSGASHINRIFDKGRWRQFVGAYPISRVTGEKMPKNAHYRKKNKPGSHNHLFFYKIGFVGTSRRKRFKRA